MLTTEIVTATKCFIVTIATTPIKESTPWKGSTPDGAWSSEQLLYKLLKCTSNQQCFPKVARVADHFNRVADQLRHFARANDPQPSATSV